MKVSTPAVCPDCNGAGVNDKMHCCKRCVGSGSIITIELSSKDAKNIIWALHDKEVSWYDRSIEAGENNGHKVYCEIEGDAYTKIRKAIESKMP